MSDESNKISVSLTVNGAAVSAEIDPRTLLADLLRKDLGLTGTHVGCDTSQCGCCVVHMNGRSVKSCTILAATTEGAEIVTIEGLAKDGKMSAMQEAFHEHHALQCGYCTPGVVMSGSELIKRNPNPTEDDVRHWLHGNLCRCTGYHNIVKAVLAAAAEARGES